ncbi:MAG: amidase, partial [Sulfitobacter sp.]|nr:amidase [Sulfitobacter sp.]
PEWRDNIRSADADAVRHYREAGAIVYGKTNVPLNLVEWQSFNVVYGSTSNPWDLTRTPGGSSGGSGVSLACGMAALELGSDIGSSIRNPAHFNGVFGLKPTWNTVSKQGHSADGWVAETDIAVAGPLARTADDLALAFDLLAHPNRFDASQWALNLPPDPRTRLKEFTVALMPGDPVSPIDAGYEATLQAFAEKLEAAGARVIRDRLPRIDSQEHFTLYLKLLGAALSAAMSDEEVAQVLALFDDAPEDVRAVGGMRMSGLALSHREWMRLDNARRIARLKFDAFFAEGVDLIIAPVASGPAFPKDEEGFRPFRRIEINGKQQLETLELFWSGYSGVVGLPSVVGPMDFVRGLPVGYQAIAGHGRDHTCLAFARAAEREIAAFTPPPLVKRGA